MLLDVISAKFFELTEDVLDVIGDAYNLEDLEKLPVDFVHLMMPNDVLSPLPKLGSILMLYVFFVSLFHSVS